MPVQRVDFFYRRKVTIYLEGEESDVVDFLTDNPDWHPLAVARDIVDYDVSELDEDGDFCITPEPRVTALRAIRDGQIVEIT